MNRKDIGLSTLGIKSPEVTATLSPTIGLNMIFIENISLFERTLITRVKCSEYK